MDMISLTATARSTDQTAKALRRDGIVPCVVYGNSVENQSLQTEHNALYKAYEQAGESTLVDLDVNGRKVPVLFHAVEFDPVKEYITHVDFYAVDMNKEIEANVPLHFEGEAPVVKEHGGILVTVLDHVTVTCLPSKLPHSLTVRIDKLAAFHDAVTIADIELPEGVTIEEDPETSVMIAQEPRKEEEVAPPPVVEGEAAAAAPAEGEAAAPAAEGEK